MIRPLFSIFDRKAHMYAAPFPHHNRATAMRAVSDQMRDPNDPMRRSAADYELCEVGTFEDDRGAVLGFTDERPVVVCSLSDLIPQG